MKKKNFTWRLDPGLVLKLKRMAKKDRRSLNNFIELILEEKANMSN